MGSFRVPQEEFFRVAALILQRGMEESEAGLQLDAIYRSLSKVAALDEREILALANYVLRSLNSNSFSPQSWFNLLLYILEREPQAIARRNVVQIISELVLRELNFSNLVRKEIAAISHACDTGSGSSEVRIFLHQCIFAWIQAGVVSAQFLKQLQQQEETWKFRGDRPRYKRTPEESPSTFDLVLLGIQGRRSVDCKIIDMRSLVREGMTQGVREGWMSIDEHGRHVVRT